MLAGIARFVGEGVGGFKYHELELKFWLSAGRMRSPELSEASRVAFKSSYYGFRMREKRHTDQK